MWAFQIGPVAILPGVDLLLLEGLDEALAPGVVVRVAGPAHAGYDAMLHQQVDVGVGVRTCIPPVRSE